MRPEIKTAVIITLIVAIITIFHNIRMNVEIDNVDLGSFTGWSKEYKDHPTIGKLIKEAIADNKITKGEYIDVLYVVVDDNDKVLEVKKSKRLEEIKNNTKDVK